MRKSQGSAAAPSKSILRRLNEEFVAGLAERLAEIESAWLAFRNDRDLAAWDRLQRQVHRLSGAGATFGFPAISDEAFATEHLMKSLDDPRAATPARVEAVARRLVRLRATCEAAALQPTPDSGEFALVELARGRDPRSVLLVEDDPAVAAHLAASLEAKGFRVTVADSPGNLCQVNEQLQAAAILMDVIFEEGALAGPEAVAMMQARCVDPPPVIFFSSRPDFEARLASVRAGGAAYFTKPIDIDQLAEKLDVLTGRRPRRPYRILVVDDDEQLAELYARTLRAGGMQAKTCTNPLLVMEELSGHEPDLVLLDYHMPDCNGPELARTLRQAEGYESLPIVFLSTEADRDLQIRALTAGGDEFLTKPIEPRHLVVAVANRAERGRQLQGLVDHDGLTRLLNSASLKRNLQIEIARARRLRRPLSFAMLDIDFFKQVNDARGHVAGDRILVTLANLLSDRLRITDVIGRWGGDEIGVVLPQTTAREALLAIEPIRRQFAELELDSRRSVSFSCGIADLAADATDVAFVEAADAALYRAKLEGRNRIVCATTEPS